MKIDRLIGILSVLLQKEKITAPELAACFEVSRRTINRDIEDLCRAGIPIQTSQGSGGGISIMEGYRMDRTILTSKDMQVILAGLRSLDSVSGSSYYGQLMEKIQTGSSNLVSGRDSILIDLSSWYKGSLASKIEVIQDAIENRNHLKFKYYAPSGESKRTIEPYYIIYKWTSWYVYGWCLKRKESAQPREIILKALFAPDMKWRLVEEFGPDCYEVAEDGRLLLVEEYYDLENMIMWLLTFGDKVEVLEPQVARERLRDLADAMRKMYKD